MTYRSITKQATQRLIFSLGLFVLVVGLSTAQFYRQTLAKANHERAADMERFFQSRLLQLERDWELQSADFRVRLEVTRLLEDPATPVTTLQAFMTMQGTNRRFHYLLIQDRQGKQVFAFGKALTLERIPLAESEDSGWFQDPATGGLYRVNVLPIWLGAAGMGRLALFFPVDNSLLQQMAAPDITLAALYHGTPVASSRGQQGIETFAASHAGQADAYDYRQLPWGGRANDPTRLEFQAPVKVLFSTAELALSMAVIPIIDGLILWFTLGTWLMRNSRRITHLGDAVAAFADRHELAPALHGSLAAARGGEDDEIRQVANALDELTRQSVAREEKIRALFDRSADAVIIHDLNGRVLDANLTFLRRYGYSRDELSALDLHGIELPGAVCYTDEHQARLVAEGTVICEARHRTKGGEEFPVEVNASLIHQDGTHLILSTCRDITERKRAEEELSRKNAELQEALANVRTLSGMLPICANCKKIRDDQGYWRQIEAYIMKHTDTQFSHGICPGCMEKLYPREEYPGLYDGTPIPGLPAD